MSVITDREYKFICNLVYEYSRINLGPNKRELVTSRLNKRLKALHIPDFPTYCKLLKSNQRDDELTNLIDAISTNHTHFFREIKHFDFLKETALPEAFANLNKTSHKTYKLWSCASSSGEEPYSLAITLEEYFSHKHNFDWRISATDISTKVLEKAQTAIYHHNRIGDIPSAYLSRYFQKGTKKWEGYYRVKEDIRNKMQFIRLNLLQPSYPFNSMFDTIFCRNVMIYFDRQTQETLINKLARNLKPKGYLMIGHSESLTGIKHSLKPIKPAIYQKV